jgi:hypothetical protein
MLYSATDMVEFDPPPPIAAAVHWQIVNTTLKLTVPNHMRSVALSVPELSAAHSGDRAGRLRRCPCAALRPGDTTAAYLNRELVDDRVATIEHGGVVSTAGD